MSFAGRARELIVRQSGAVASAPSNFTTLAIIGTSLGGAAFLVLVSVGIMHFRYIRHRRALSLEGEFAVNGREDFNEARSHIFSTQQATQGQRSQITAGEVEGWETSPSQDDLHDQEVPIARRRAEKRTSDLLSWPLPGKERSKRPKSLKRIRNSHLAAIPESPVGPSRGQQSRKSTGAGVMHEDTPVELEAMTASEILKFQGGRYPSAFTSDKTLAPQASARREKPLFSNMRYGQLQGAIARPRSDRSASDPAIWTCGVQNASSGFMSANMHQTGRLRSFSASGNRAAPTAPLPPLPTMGVHQESAQVVVSARPASNASASSIDSMGTSILNSPEMKTSVDFSQERSGPNVGSRNPRKDPNVKSALMAGPKHSRVRSRITNSPRLNSSCASLRITSVRNSMELKRLSTGENSKRVQDKRMSSGSLQTAQAIVISRPSSQSSQVELTKDVVATPKREQHKHKVSDALGSPIQRRRSGVLKVSAAKGPMPPRETSQTSTITASSESPGNPFQWDSPETSTKRGSLKGSPSSKKTHKRQQSVRTAVALAHQRPLSRSTSSSKMVQIVEESRDSSDTLNCEQHQSMSRPPSSATFAPQLKNPSHYRASLTTESPRLSLLQYEQDGENEKSSNKGYGKTTASPRTNGALPESNRSSTMISAFPIPSSSNTRDSTGSEPFTSTSLSVDTRPAIYSHFSSSPRQYIPGLSLVDQSDMFAQELQYPTIELMHSPEPYETEFQQDSPTIPCISSPGLSHAELPSSPPVPRSLSPPLKSSATTQLSSLTMPIQTQRITPLSSTVNPMNTKPNFAPPTVAGTEERQRTLYGAYATHADNVFNTAKALRRMKTGSNIETIDEKPRYCSPKGHQADIIVTESTLDQSILDEEKENEKVKRGGLVLDDIDEFWSSSVASGDKGGVLLETPVASTKRVAWGPVDVRETTPSVASDGGRSFGEDDFF